MVEAGMKKSNLQLHLFDVREALHVSLSHRIAALLQDAISGKGHAFLALSGGSTPKPLFERLSHMDLEWDKVTVTLVDERWVASDDARSNERLVCETLLKDRAAAAKFVGLKSAEATPYEGEAACCKRIDAIEGEIDVCVLGMGTDGHTASFFPEAATLQKALTTTQSCVALTPPVAPCERMTLSLNKLARSKHLIVHIEGDEKWQVYSAALQEGPVETMPIRAFLRAETAQKIEVYYAQ